MGHILNLKLKKKKKKKKKKILSLICFVHDIGFLNPGRNWPTTLQSIKTNTQKWFWHPGETCRQHLQQNKPLGIGMTPHKMQNLVIWRADFSIFSQIWANIGSNLRQFWKKSGGFTQKMAINNTYYFGIWMGHFFLTKISISISRGGL